MSTFNLNKTVKNNYILIDYENVQPSDIAILSEHFFKVIVFVGANQEKISFSVASALQSLGNKAEYIKINGNGKNALDFHIAFYIGQISATDPDAYFHIISKDTGFDPLIKHLKERNIFAKREQTLNEVPLIHLSSVMSIEEKIDLIVKNLSDRHNSRPRKVETLINTINSMFMKKLEQTDLKAIVIKMESQGFIEITNDKVSYKPPISSL